MERTFFQLEDDVRPKGRWFLNGLSDSGGRALDADDLTSGLPVDIGPPLRLSLSTENKVIDVKAPLRVSLRRPGRALDITFADFDLPVVTTRIAELLFSVAPNDIQVIPVCVDGQKQEYSIINVVSRLPCIDTARSDIQYLTESAARPDMIGKPEMILKLIIDPDAVGNHHIVRPEDWEVAIIVSDVVKYALEREHATGIAFRSVF